MSSKREEMNKVLAAGMLPEGESVDNDGQLWSLDGYYFINEKTRESILDQIETIENKYNVSAGEPPELGEDIIKLLAEYDSPMSWKGDDTTETHRSRFSRQIIAKLLPWHNAEMERKGQETAREIIDNIVGQNSPCDKLRHLTARLGCEVELLRPDKIMGIGEEIDKQIEILEALKAQYGVKE